jgi:HEAT repeat protein
MHPVLFGFAIACALSSAAKDPGQPEYWQRIWTKAGGSEARLRVLEEVGNSSHLEVALPVLHEAFQKETDPRVKIGLTRLLIRSRDTSVALEAVDELVKLAPPQETSASLLPVAMDESTPPVVTKRIIEVFGDWGRPDPVPQLVELLVHEHQGRSFAQESAFALFQIGEPAVDALVAVLKREGSPALAWARAHGAEPLLLARAADVLGDLGDRRAEGPLIALLSFEHRHEPLVLLVRRDAADALGRLRSSAGRQPLVAMLNEPDGAALARYARALGQIGGREALAGLAQAATGGEWGGREVAIAGFTLLGDERELRAFEKMVQSEEESIRAWCRENPVYDGCEKPNHLAEKHGELIRVYGKRLEAAKLCKQMARCWAEKLDDPETRVRERAALELGKLGDSAQLDALFAHLDDKDGQVQFVIVQSLHWLLNASPAARERARDQLPDIERRLAEGQGQYRFTRLRQPLRRLAFRIRGYGIKSHRLVASRTDPGTPAGMFGSIPVQPSR